MIDRLDDSPAEIPVERIAALADAAFLEDLARSFLRINVRAKGSGTAARAVADASAQEFAMRAERLHLIAQRLRGMQP